MYKLQKSQSGFSAVEGLLVVLILLVVGAVGYMVYHNDHKTAAAITATAATKSANAKTTTAPDPYAGWQTYTGTDLKLKYPTDWNAKVENFGQDGAVWGAAITLNPNAVPTNTEAFINPPASYSKSNSYTISIKEFTVPTSDYLSYSSGIGYNQSTPYNYLKTSGQITSGIFKGNYLTFLSQLNTIKNVTNKLATQGLVTSQSYAGSNGTMTEQGFVTANGKTYQITVDSTDDSSGNGYPSVFNMSAFTKTDLYKNTVSILNSAQ